MASMNSIEKFVYDTVKSNPKLKGKIRNLYQAAFDLLPKKKDFSLHEIVLNEGYFFGFHDISPFSLDDTKILANKLTIPFRMPQITDPLEVGYFTDPENLTDFVQIGVSKAWNYHKGCRLQWANADTVMYNDSIDHKLVSRQYHLPTKITKTIDYPIDAVSSDGAFASSFSYERLEALMPGYGYGFTDEAYLNENLPEETGLFLIDVANNGSKLLISLKELGSLGGIPGTVLSEKHFVTHTLFSPDNRYISFLHRSVDITNVQKRWSRFCVFDLQTLECHVGPTDDMISHYVWNNKNEIIAYCRINGVDSHVLFKEPTLKEYKVIAYPRLNSDGHQSFINDTNFVTDTYPDKYRMANLYTVNAVTNEVKQIASLNSAKKYRSQLNKHWACDLHPRMNRKGDVVCFDSVHTGERALCVMKIN